MLALIDCLQSLAIVALQPGYTKPTIVDDDMLHIVNGRHPMVEAVRSDPFVPNTVMIGSVSRPSQWPRDCSLSIYLPHNRAILEQRSSPVRGCFHLIWTSCSSRCRTQHERQKHLLSHGSPGGSSYNRRGSFDSQFRRSRFWLRLVHTSLLLLSRCLCTTPF